MTQPLFAACGVGRGCRTLLDCTAGLLGDALLLAGKGMIVEAWERNPHIAARQREMVEALRTGGSGGSGGAGGDLAALERLTLREGDAREALRAIAESARPDRPDVVYIDPMHPPRRKAALVKKDMRDLREIVGSDDDAGELLAWGLLAAGRRVTVKWPRVGPGLENRLPAWWIERFGDKPLKPAGTVIGRATRWDVFAPRSS